MKAVVLVGGEGTRLRPLTETRPKPLIPFLNRPFLHHVLDRLGEHGVQEVVLSSPYLEAEFHGFLEEREGVPAVSWITEEQPLGTGGAVAGARSHVSDTFFVLNGDILTDLDLGALLAFHRERGAIATIALTPVEDARPFGLVETEADGRVRAFREKPEDLVPGNVNAGTYVLEPSALDGTPEGLQVSIERETFPRLIATGEAVYAYTTESYWRDLGTPEAYLAGHLDALAGRIGGIEVDAPLLGEGARIDAAARVDRTVVLGAGTVVGTGASVSRSVLHERVVLGPGASVEGSIIGPACVVGPGARVVGALLADRVRIEDATSVEGERIGPDQVIGPGQRVS